MAKVLGISLCLFLILAVVNGDDAVHSESDLRKALFENYDKLVRPVHNLHDAIHVRTVIYPVAIKDVDVKDHIVKLDAWLYTRWVDEYLTWDPSAYGGLQALRVDAHEIWRPDISVYFGTPDTHLFPAVHSNVVLFYNGTVLWIPPFTVKSHCCDKDEHHNDTEDTFHCTILVGSWSYDATLLDIQEHVGDALERSKESFRDHNHEWTLESMKVHHELKLYDCCTEHYSLVKHDLVLKKRHHHDHKDDHHDSHHDHKDDHHDHKDDHHDSHHDAHHDAHHAHDGDHGAHDAAHAQHEANHAHNEVAHAHRK